MKLEDTIADVSGNGAPAEQNGSHAQAAAPVAEAGPRHGLRDEVAEGLLYTHSRLNATTGKTLEATSSLYALVELLDDKGLITIEELDGRQHVVSQRLAAQFKDS